MIRRYIIFSLFLVLALFVAVSMNPSAIKARSVPSPDDTTGVSTLKFSHKFHITEAGIECATCHAAVNTSKKASDNLYPSHENCASCHEDQVTNNCAYCHTNPNNIVSREVPPRDVLFSHQAHVGIQGVQCQTCHVDIDSSADVSTSHLPTMAGCNGCHNDKQVTNQCEKCHTNFAQLLPKDHLRHDFRRFHGEETRLGALSVECQTCHKETFCQECHQTTGLKQFGGRDLSTDPRPKTSPKDSPRETVLQRVHDLNYKFTHGVDAKSRRTDCATCHDTQEFCSQCHQAGGNITQSHFRPASHLVPGFVKLGAGSGGGLHADEARRDMESCASCHDADGQDPTCLTCHAENGKVR